MYGQNRRKIEYTMPAKLKNLIYFLNLCSTSEQTLIFLLNLMLIFRTEINPSSNTFICELHNICIKMKNKEPKLNPNKDKEN